MRISRGFFFTAVLSAVLLSGCGGDDVFTGVPDGSGTNPDVEIGDIRLLLSNPTLNSGVDTVADPSNPAEAVIVTAIVTDEGAVVVPDFDVSFSIPARNGTLQVINSKTDASGVARAFLTNGGNVLDRTISVRVQAGDLSRSIDVEVEGTSITLDGPASLGLGSTASYRVRLTNGRGVDSPTAGGIAAEPILVESAPGTALNIVNSNGSETDEIGVFEFDVVGARSTPPGSPEVLSVSALNEVASLPITVSQFSIATTGVTDLESVPLGESVNLTVTLSDSDGPVEGERLDFGATRGSVSPSTALTDENGQVAAEFTASGGVGRSLVRVFGPNGSIGDVDFQLITENPFRVDLQADPGTIEVNKTTRFTATVRDPDGNLVSGQAVEFDLEDVTGGVLSTPRVITDAQGRASVTYQASSSPSGNRAVIVRAYTPGSYNPLGGSVCNDIDGNGDDSENSDSNGGGSDTNLLCDQFALTVGGLALRVALGTGNTIEEPTETTYRMPWSALVTDSAGNPAPPGTTLRLKVTPLAYQKGTSIYLDPVWVRLYSVFDFDETPPAQEDDDFLFLRPGDPRRSFGDGCVAEDLNENGILDVGEDFNGDGILTPSNVASVPQGVGDDNEEVALTPEGFAFFDIAFAQQYAQWVRVRLTAIASVDGTEAVESQVFLLPGLAEDFSDEEVPPPGANSPFGTGSVCTDTR